MSVGRSFTLFLLVGAYASSAFAWTSPIDITNLSGVREVGPSLAHDTAGNLYAVWFGNGSTAGADGDSSLWKVWFQSHDSVNWSAANALALSGAGAGSPEIAVDGNNNLHLVYDQGQEIFYRSRIAGNWSVPVNLSNNSNKSIVPHLAVSSDGNSILVGWHEQGHTNGTYDIITRHYASGTWEPVVNISNDNGVSSEARIAVDSSGNFHVIWQDSDADHVYYRKRSTNGSWGAQATLDKNSSRSGTGDVIVTPDNLVHVIFHDDTTVNWETYYTFFNGSIWSNPVNISNNPGSSNDKDDIDGNLASDSFGRLYAVWHDYNDIFFSQQLSGVWTAPVKLANGVYDAVSPRITIRSDGVAQVVWQMRPTSGDGWDVYWSSQSFTPPPPQGTMAGTVRDQFNALVTGATVTAGAATAVTDGSGHYSFNLNPGTYSGSASKVFYQTATSNNITITVNITTTVNFVINRQGASAVTTMTVTATNTTNILQWTNPGSGQFAGTMIRFSTAGFPTGPADGTLLTDQANPPGSNDSTTHTGLTNGTTYYYSAFAHDGVAPIVYAAGVNASGIPALACDYDRDGDVDQIDFAHFQTCLSGSTIPQTNLDCQNADLDHDMNGDVSAADLGLLLACYNGPDHPANPTCLP